MVEDFASPDFNTEAASVNIVVASMSDSMCCGLKGLSTTSSNCNCPANTKPKQIIAKQSGIYVQKAVKGFTDLYYNCVGGAGAVTNQRPDQFRTAINDQLKDNGYKVKEDTLYFPLELTFREM